MILQVYKNETLSVIDRNEVNTFLHGPAGRIFYEGICKKNITFCMHLKSYLYIFVIIIFPTVSCREKQPTQMLIIEEEKLLNSIPSASGLAIENDMAWIVGDDATSIYRLNLTSFEQQKIPLKGFDA